MTEDQENIVFKLLALLAARTDLIFKPEIQNALKDIGQEITITPVYDPNPHKEDMQ